MIYCEDYLFKNGKTFLVDKDGNESYFCEEVKIVKVKKNISDGEETVVVSIIGKNGYKGSVELKREVLSSGFVTKLTAQGLTLASEPEYKVTLQEILYDTEKTAEMSFVHDWLGFKDINGIMTYYGAKGDTNGVVSNYQDEKVVATAGTFESWRDGIKPFIDEKPELFIGLAMGATAPIVTLLKMVGAIDETPIWGKVTDSSKGKTTSLKLDASIWGVPTSDGLIENFNGTEKYIYACLSERKGFPTFFDETSAQPSWDFTRMLYKIAMGSSGGKCAPNGSKIAPRTWSGTFIYTGEKSIFAQTNQNKGLYARVIEFDYEWTKPGMMADDIVEHISENYGTAYIPWIELLKTISQQRLKELYKMRIEELQNLLKPENGVQGRIVKKLALLLLTTDMLKKAWNIQIKRSKILELLKETYLKNIPQISKAELTYQVVKEYVTNHRGLFPPAKTMQNSMYIGSQQGAMEKYKKRDCVWVIGGVFDKILDDNKIELTHADYQEMVNKGMIAYFGDRYRKNHKIAGISNKCVCIFLDVYDSSENSDSNKQSYIERRRRQMKKKHSNIKNLLADDDNEGEDKAV